MCDEHDEGERVRSGVLALAERTGYGDTVAWYWLQESWRPLMRAESDRFRELVERALAAAREVGEPVTEAAAENCIATLELEQGRAEAALARVEAVRQRVIAAGAGVTLPHVEVRLAEARAALGDLDGARAGLEPLVASGVDFGWGLASTTIKLADVLRVAGDTAGAEMRSREALAISERINSRQGIASSNETLALLAVGRGEYIDAETLLHEALALRVKHELFLNLPRTLDALAEVAAGLESHEEAVRILGIAQRTRNDRDLVRWAPDNARLAELERALRSTLGDPAFEAAQEEGASLTLEDAIAWIRRTRGERKRPARGWESLTPTELKVIELVAEGLTNPQIGERMFITRGTVKVHLSHIFAKLGTSTRAELAAETTRRSGAADQPPSAGALS